jgi:hypothetical protein
MIGPDVGGKVFGDSLAIGVLSGIGSMFLADFVLKLFVLQPVNKRTAGSAVTRRIVKLRTSLLTCIALIAPSALCFPPIQLVDIFS